MIKQIFYYDNKIILQVYHENFPNYQRHEKLHKTKQLDEGKVELREYWIEELERENTIYDSIAHGFLHVNHSKNPYSTLCCNYKEFITYDKDSELIKDKQVTNIKEFKLLAEFVKKWCGYDLLKSPFSLNNTLFFKPAEINPKISLDDNNEKVLKLIVPESRYSKLMCITKFKQGDNIVDTQISAEVSEEIDIEPKENWSSVDLELYSDSDLVYAYYDLSFINSINFNMNFVTRQVNVDLKKANKSIELTSVSSSTTQFGDSTISEELLSYYRQEHLIKDQLNIKKRIEFLTKDEYERGLDILSDIANTSGYTEMWIFDPYFISLDIGGGKDRINDIIKVLGSNLNLKKKIVFEKSKGDFTAFKGAIKDTVEELQKREISLDFNFFGTETRFHDRFIFLKNEDQMQSFLFGTSFNSLGDNYSTVVELNSINGKSIFEILMKDVASDEYISVHEQLL